MVGWEDEPTPMSRNDIESMRKDQSSTSKADTFDDAASVASTSRNGVDNSQDGSAIGGRENTQVTILRVAVLLVLLLAAGGVCALVYVFTKQAENDEFQTKFEGVAAKVLESFVSHLEVLSIS